MKKIIFSFFVLVLIVLTITSCERHNVISSLKKEELFTIKYGAFEDELSIYDMNTINEFSSKILMNKGFFFISDSKQSKVMQLTSYGDLIKLFYNQAINPIPSFVNISKDTTNTAEKVTATKKAFTYPFRKITSIAVDEKKNLYIADYLPEERYEQDAISNQIKLRQIIVRFTESGEILDYLGQQGPGGIPFPYIKKIFTTVNNELVVICLSVEGYRVFWFTDKGFQKWMIPINIAGLPRLELKDVQNEVYVNLDSIIPDYVEQKLYLKLDYSVSEIDASSKVQSGIKYLKTLLYTLDIETGLYEEPLLIPAHEEILTDEFSKQIYNIPYEFLGVTETGWFFFIISNPDGYTIMMVQPNGQKMIRRNLSINTDTMVFYDFSLSPEGILSALLSDNEKTTVVWWRTDQIINNLIKE